MFRASESYVTYLGKIWTHHLWPLKTSIRRVIYNYFIHVKMYLSPYLSILLDWRVRGQLPKKGNQTSAIQWMSLSGQSKQTLKSRKSNIITQVFILLLINGTLSLEAHKLQKSCLCSAQMERLYLTKWIIFGDLKTTTTKTLEMYRWSHEGLLRSRHVQSLYILKI